MFTFEELTEVNGFDIKHPKNAIQNSYAWSMAQLGDYIYVGTSRNMFSSMASFATNSGSLPPDLITGCDNNAEIWRYKVDGSKPWKRVYKASTEDNIIGFRAMTVHKSNGCTAIYAASFGENVKVIKSTDGLHWEKINTSNVKGGSSRALVSFNKKLYLATIEGSVGNGKTYLYESYDPEFEPFHLVTNPKTPCYMPNKNPRGSIYDLQVFDNKLYVCTATESGAEVWRSNDRNISANNWTLVADKGFGDKTNKTIMSTGVFNGHMYVAVTKLLPLSIMVPFGFDLIMIDKCDNWKVVVGGEPLIKTCPTKGKRNKSLSGFNSGFNNYFNLYGWQITEFKNNLVITTYDASTTMAIILENLIYNKESYINRIGHKKYCTLIKSYAQIICLLKKYKYPKGFDFYASQDGIHFRPVILNGLDDPFNYGGRTLLVSNDKNDLYLGTANPFYGCEVWQVNYNPYSSSCSYNSAICYFKNLKKMNKELIKLYPALISILSTSFN